MESRSRRACALTMLFLASCIAAQGQTTTTSLERSMAALEGTVRNEPGSPASGVFVTTISRSGTLPSTATDSENKVQVGWKRTKGPDANQNESSDDSTPSDVWRNTLQGTVTSASGDTLSGVVVALNAPRDNFKTALGDSAGRFRINAALPTSGTAKREKSGSTIGFWALQGLMFATSIAAAETTHNCLQAGSCTGIPTLFQSRAAMYNAGLPLAAGIAVLSYEMKQHRNHWWPLPPAFVVAANSVLTFHAARASH